MVIRTGIQKLALAGLCACSLRGQAPPAAAPAHALTLNLSLASQYLFRGLTQTDRKPALQGGLDYAHTSGFYAGLWASNISWIDDFNPGASVKLEVDATLGFRRTFAEDWTCDVGFIRYQYPGSYPAAAVRADTNELYAGLSWRFLALKYSVALGDVFGVPQAKGTSYLEGSVAAPLTAKVTLNLHAGRQAYRGQVNGIDNRVYSYSDWKAELVWGLAEDWSLGAGYSATDAREDVYTPAATGRFIGQGQAFGFLKRTF